VKVHQRRGISLCKFVNPSCDFVSKKQALILKKQDEQNSKQNNNMIFLKTIISFIKDKEYRDLMLTTWVILGIGTVVYHFVEGWSWLDSAYFSVITLTTVGYGDFSPQTPGGKIFTMVYILMGIGIILSFLNTVSHHYTKVKSDKNLVDENKDLMI